jgi:hypothetical protein
MTKTDETILEQSHKIKVAPAAITYLRRYAIFPGHVKATGPRGHLTKQDVLGYVNRMNLKTVELKRPASDFIDLDEFREKPQPVKE